MNVYFIKSGHSGPIKIGIAKNVKRRLEQLQIGNPVKLYVLATIPCASRLHAHDMEARLHKAHHKNHIRGEWFNACIKLKGIDDFVTDCERQSLSKSKIARKDNVKAMKTHDNLDNQVRLILG